MKFLQRKKIVAWVVRIFVLLFGVGLIVSLPDNFMDVAQAASPSGTCWYTYIHYGTNGKVLDTFAKSSAEVAFNSIECYQNSDCIGKCTSTANTTLDGKKFSGYECTSAEPLCEGVPGPYCWCQHSDLSCSNEPKDASGEPFAGDQNGKSRCDVFCANRFPDGQAANYDPKYIEKNGNNNNTKGVCNPKDTTGAGALGGGLVGGGTAKFGAGSSEDLYNPLAPKDVRIDFRTILSRIITALIGVVGSIALLMFVYGGILWMTAGGAGDNVKKAQNIIKFSIYGLLIIAFSYMIVTVFFSAFNAAIPSTTPAAPTTPTT